MRKKLLSLLTLALLSVGSAWAAEETVSLVSYTVSNNIAVLTSESGKVSVTLSKEDGSAVNGADSKNRGFRWQNNRVVTIALAEGLKINSVIFTANKNGNKLSSSNTMTLTDGSNVLSGSWDTNPLSEKMESYTWTATTGTNYGTWVATNTSSGDIYIASITINYGEASYENAAPLIVSQPAAAINAYVGYETSLTVGATGYPTPSYQWYSNTTASNVGGTVIEGATSAIYTFTPENVGTYYYYAVATNNYDNTNHSVASNVSTVTVGLKYKVSYNAGVSGATVSIPLPTADYVADAKITLPSNHYFYLEGKSLSKWSDGTNEYAPGTEYTVTGDVTFVPVFEDNTKVLGDEPTTITWTFARGQGAPSYAVEGDGKTTSVIGTTANGIDLKMDIVLSKQGDGVGKFNNTSDEVRCQVNASTSFTIPAVSGMTVSYTTTNGTLKTEDDVLFGEEHATSINGKNYVYTYTGSAETLTISDNVGGHYPSGISVSYPLKPTKCATPTIAVGDFSFANKGYTVTITSGNSLWVSTDGTSYTEQTSPYTVPVTATTTFFAKATGEGLEDSEVAEQEVTYVFDNSKPFVAWVYTKGYGSASYAFDTDPMVAAMQNVYNVVEVNYSADTTPSTDLNNADLIVCTEAMTGNKTLSNGMKAFAGVTPMIGLKAYNYTKGRWSWGTPANPSPTAQSFTPKSIGYKVLTGVSFESDGTIKLATAESGNVIQTVEFGTTDTTTPAGNIILGTIGGADNKAVMYTSNKYFGLGLSSDCWATYTENAITIVKNAAAMLIADEPLDAYDASTITKTISAAGYATLCSEYPLDFTGSGLTAYIATVDNKVVTFSEVSSVPANTGVLLKGAAGEKTITVAASTTDVTANRLVGVLVDTPVGEGNFVLMNGNNGVGFYKTSAAGFTVGAHTAYLPANVVAGARTFIGFDNETTGISAALNDNGEMTNGKYVYDLQGRRMQSSDLKKGLYIVGGKKVVK